MSSTFVNNDGQLGWREIGYHARGVFAVLLSVVVLFDDGWFVVHKAREAQVSQHTESDYIGEGKDEVVMVIPRDATVAQIGDIPVENSVVKSTRTSHSVVGCQMEPNSKPQAGCFRLHTELPVETALKMLSDPANKVVLKVTLPKERAQVQQWEILTKELGLIEEQLTETSKSSELELPNWVGGSGKLEGFLFPETYEVAESVITLGILKQQMKQFDGVMGVISLESRTKDIGRSSYGVLIITSTVEREAIRTENRPRITQAVYNRSAKDLPLQFDSTVHYTIGQFDRTTTTEEDQVTGSPYNTYKVKGLSPTPISNPGWSAIESALVPSSENFLYFTTVDLDTGETRYSTDGAGHMEGVKLFQQWCQSYSGRCA